MPAININLKSLRQAKGMTQADVAEAISVTRQTVSSYESGRTQPDLETMKRLAEVYQVDIDDVLYGGNRLQQKLKQILRVIVILASVMLIGVLVHSILFWTVNNFFPPPTTEITADNRQYIEMRFALRDMAERISGICTTIFGIGCIAMIYPCIAVAHAIQLRRLLIIFFLIVTAMFVCVIPFASADNVYSFADYIMPVWIGLLFSCLLFGVTLAVGLIKRRRRL